MYKKVLCSMALVGLMAAPALAADTATGDVQFNIANYNNVEITNVSMANYDGNSGEDLTGQVDFTAQTNNISGASMACETGTSASTASMAAGYSHLSGLTGVTLTCGTNMVGGGTYIANTGPKSDAFELTISGLDNTSTPGDYAGTVTLTIAP